MSTKKRGPLKCPRLQYCDWILICSNQFYCYVYTPSAYSNLNNTENTNAPPRCSYWSNASALRASRGVHNNISHKKAEGCWGIRLRLLEGSALRLCTEICLLDSKNQLLIENNVMNPKPGLFLGLGFIRKFVLVSKFRKIPKNFLRMYLELYWIVSIFQGGFSIYNLNFSICIKTLKICSVKQKSPLIYLAIHNLQFRHFGY